MLVGFLLGLLSLFLLMLGGFIYVLWLARRIGQSVSRSSRGFDEAAREMCPPTRPEPPAVSERECTDLITMRQASEQGLRWDEVATQLRRELSQIKGLGGPDTEAP